MELPVRVSVSGSVVVVTADLGALLCVNSRDEVCYDSEHGGKHEEPPERSTR